MSNVASLVRWFCSQLTKKELFEAIEILIEVRNGLRQDIELKSTFREDHPNYRQFEVEQTPPLSDPPQADPPLAGADWTELLAAYEREHGRALPPVRPRSNSYRPPAETRCEYCNAPAQWLSVNDGKKRSQVRCKVCKKLSPIRRIRHQSQTRYWCPHCQAAMFRWKCRAECTIYKCGNRKCPHYCRQFEALNERERALAETGASSQFKLHYQWREYHFDPKVPRPEEPGAPPRSLLDIRRNLNAVGLALAYAVSLGLSARHTAQAMREIHGIKVSHQTVLNWLEAAAPLAQRALDTLHGRLREGTVAADETYIKVRGVWHYTWFVVGAISRAIWGWNVADNRGMMPAVAVVNQTLDQRPDDAGDPLVLVADGNPSYDAATNAINTDANGKPLPTDERSVERYTVIGLKNEDPQSTAYRPFKQIIERLNRTYRYHTRSRSGHKSLNGARALTTLFVAHYNFLRPHRALRNRPPIHLPELDDIQNLQGRWLKLLAL